MFNHKITYYLMSVATALLTVAFTMTSCIMEDGVVDEVVNADQKTCKVSLMLNLGNVTTRGSNSYSIGTEGGSDIENYIDLSDLKLLIFNRALNSAGTGCSSTIGNDANDTLQQVINLTKIDHIDGTTLYNVTGELLEGAPSGSFRVVVAANWSKWCSCAPISKKLYDYCVTDGGTFIYPTKTGERSWEPTTDKPIPMYGVKAFGAGAELTPSFIPGMTTDLGQINVIRAVAKVELIAKDASITNVKMTYNSPAGMMAPYGMCESTSQVTDDNLNVPLYRDANWWSHLYNTHGIGVTEKGARMAASSLVKDILPIVDKADSLGHFTFYVPEYGQKLSIYSSNKPKLTFHIATTLNPDGRDCELEFKRYTNNVEFNILRNNIYRYEVEMPNTAVTIDYNVIDWNDQTAGDIVFE